MTDDRPEQTKHLKQAGLLVHQTPFCRERGSEGEKERTQLVGAIIETGKQTQKKRGKKGETSGRYLPCNSVSMPSLLSSPEKEGEGEGGAKRNLLAPSSLSPSLSLSFPFAVIDIPRRRKVFLCTNVIPGLGNVTAGEGEEKKESKERKRRRDKETEKRGNGGTADTFHPVRAVRNARSLSPLRVGRPTHSSKRR